MGLPFSLCGGAAQGESRMVFDLLRKKAARTDVDAPKLKQITARGKARLTVLFRDIGDDCGWTCSRVNYTPATSQIGDAKYSGQGGSIGPGVEVAGWSGEGPN